MRSFFWATSLSICLSLLSCRDKKDPENPTTKITQPATPEDIQTLRDNASSLAKQPEKNIPEIQVQHLLIAYKDSGMDGITRTLDEAEQLAASIWIEAKKGQDFDSLVKSYTDDQYPGVYTMVQKGSANPDEKIFKRSEMVPAFGDVGFRLEVGEVGVALFNPATSPYGYHIIKRLK